MKKRTSAWKPECVHEDTWRIWEAYWDRPEVKAKSEQARKNRMSDVAGPGTGCSRHTGGSRSSIEHFHALRATLQKDPDPYECFEHTHKKKDGTFDEIQARRDAAILEAEGSNEPPVINMSQLYVDVVGGVKKQRIYGLGTKSFAFITENNCSSSSATSQLQQESMKEMVNQQLETMRVEMEAKLQGEMEAKLQAERTQMQAQIASLMDELRRNGMLSTPSTQPQHSANSNDENLGDD
ncbi:PREDICTED: uncharacterized protein LOC109151194 [Ipomoea nil]|uniref:uncharacterized protein LOC109151194 n=1 Tax=Ipomoea nil TaxID=35883 RepID=UPI00090168AE|nr:PREDICTED: uncharacterized protein LOC109151194 [Ipomoea nil]